MRGSVPVVFGSAAGWKESISRGVSFPRLSGQILGVVEDAEDGYRRYLDLVTPPCPVLSVDQVLAGGMVSSWCSRVGVSVSGAGV